MNYVRIYNTSITNINTLIIFLNGISIYRSTERWIDQKGFYTCFSQTSTYNDDWHYVLRK